MVLPRLLRNKRSHAGHDLGPAWVYLWRERFQPAQLAVTLSNSALLTAIDMPTSIVLQFCLIITSALSLTMVVSWALLLTVMAVPYVFAGVVVSLALARSPFPTGQVYGVDLLGAALGCVAVLVLLNGLDGHTAVIVAGAFSGLSSLAFAASANAEDREQLKSKPWWRQPATVVVALVALALFNALSPLGFGPILVKNSIDNWGKHGL